MGKPFLEFFGIFLREVRQSVDKHELGKNLRQRVVAFHFCREPVYGCVVVTEISFVCPRVNFLLHVIHFPEIVEILRVEHGLSVRGVGEIVYDHPAPFLRFRLVVLAHCHQI